MSYPRVADEFETIRKVARGYSLARFGDGELKMAHGAGYSREPGSARLAAELTGIIQKPHARCVVGIPTMDARGPKYLNWTRHADRFETIVSRDVRYYSAFVSRPDSAPWINVREYAELVQNLWAGKRVAAVCERRNSLLALVRKTAAKVRHVECPHAQAYAVIDELERQVFAQLPDVVVMSAGPTATCLANRLAARGLHAVDLGSAGGFLRKLLA